MTYLATGGESGGNVIGICSPGVIRLVARVAVRGRTREHVIDVARRAGYGNVRPGQRERGLIVIEHRSIPRRCVVAGFAGRGESRRDVIGIRGPGVIRLVAGVAISRHRCVVVIGVAQRASHSGMSARKREGGGGVIKA